MELSGICAPVASIAGLEKSTPRHSPRTSSHGSRKPNWGIPISTSVERKLPIGGDAVEEFDLHIKDSSSSDNEELWNTLDNITALGLSFSNLDDSPILDRRNAERFSLDAVYDASADRSLPLEVTDQPFSKWMKTLQRRGRVQRRKTLSGEMDSVALEKEFFESPGTRRRVDHKKSSSGSSFGFVTAVKSASISLASFSIAPRSRRTGMSSRYQRTDRSSKASNVGRLSEDSSYLARNAVIDQAVLTRSLHRRRVLEEIITTEESYLGDIKFLKNASISTEPQGSC